MAQVSFETAQKMEDNRPQGGSSFNFFALKNDGDEAIVRIMHNDTSSFDIYSCHSVKVGSRYRKVNCIRGPEDSIQACPLCASGNSLSNRIFIHMIQYTVDQQGQLNAQPVIWERSMQYASRLKSMLDEYGPLSECLFKIKRNGAAQSMDTTYDIFFCSPKTYPNESYPAIPDAFKDVKLLGGVVLDKSFEELNTYLATGDFPQNPVQTASQGQVTPPQYVPKTNVNIEAAPVQAPVVQQPYTPQPTAAPPVVPQQPVTTAQPQVQQQYQATVPQRPVRYY